MFFLKKYSGLIFLLNGLFFQILLLKEAVTAGAKLLCFPENFSYVGAKTGDSLKIAEPLDGPIMNKYRSLAR